MTADPVDLDIPAEAPVDGRDPAVRLTRLLDAGSLRPLHEPDGSGVLAVTGRIDGRPVSAYCTDARSMGGALGPAGAAHVVTAIRQAVAHDRPVIGLWHCGGARLADGVSSLHGAGSVFAAITAASGRVPQISVILGPAAGVAAYGSALTDVIVMAGAGRLFVTGPDVIRSVTHEDVDMETLGGARAHGKRSGVVHVIADDESDAYRRVRALTGLLRRPSRRRPDGLTGLAGPGGLTGPDGPDGPAGPDALTGPDGPDGRGPDAGHGAPPDPAAFLPDRPRRAYDVRPLVQALLDPVDDGPALLELQAGWAPNVVVGLGRLHGRRIGVVANNPLRKGGCLDSPSAEKAARFVRMCDSFGVPLLVVVDVPGYLPGVQQEWDGIVRRGAKLLHAFAAARVPRVTVMVRKAFGGAYIAMNSRALGATAVFAWPEAEVAVMGAEAAVEVVHRRTLAAAAPPELAALRERLVAEHRDTVGGIERAIDLGVVDAVIEPVSTRARVAEVLATTPGRRADRDNIPL